MSQVPYPPTDSAIPTFASVEGSSYAREIARFVALSAVLQVLAFALLVAAAPHLPQTAATNALVDLRKQAVELIAPPAPLTQKEANRAPLSKDFTVESIQRQDSPSPLPSPGAAPRPALTGKQFRVPGAPVPTPRSVLPDAPTVDVARVESLQGPPPGVGVPQSAIAPPRIEPVEKPKLAFEDVGAMTGTPGQRGGAAVPKPSTSVEDAIRAAARQGGGLVVGDVDEGISSPTPGIRPAPGGGKLGSSLELLSDPQGADFRPYLIRLLSSVRRNWFAVIPESARLGRQGRVIVRFSVTRDGRVQNFQISGPSGAEALDRAAVAGISASTPFPPLPNEFKGGWVRLQLTFLYNVQR